MKKTIACFAMIASATAAMAKEAPKKTDTRAPAAAEGASYIGCKPAFNIFKGNEEYRNECTVLPTVVQGQGFGDYSRTFCEKDFVVVVSQKPVASICLPPGAVEL